MSQSEVAREIDATPNTVSRWEIGAYSPSVDDLHALAKVFDIAVADFFPTPEPDGKLNELVVAARGLDEQEIKEIIRYVNYRRATSAITR